MKYDTKQSTYLLFTSFKNKNALDLSKSYKNNVTKFNKHNNLQA